MDSFADEKHKEIEETADNNGSSLLMFDRLAAGLIPHAKNVNKSDSPKGSHDKKVLVDEEKRKKLAENLKAVNQLEQSRFRSRTMNDQKDDHKQDTKQLPRRKTSTEAELLQQADRVASLSRSISAPPESIKTSESLKLVKKLQTGGQVDLMKIIAIFGPDVNTVLDAETGDALIHIIIKRKKKDRLDFLFMLLVNSEADVNLTNKRKMAPLHLAVEEGDVMCVKALIVFGANINQRGCNQFTPLDLAINNGKIPKIEQILYDHGAKSGTQLLGKFSRKVPRLYSIAEKMVLPQRGGRPRLRTNDLPKEFRATFNTEGGSRLLFLDGGGIRGLSQIEILMQLEERTKCKITELFDWIIGTSVGAIIALAMVYGKKSLKELGQLFFQLKSRVFSNVRFGMMSNSTEELEEILKDCLGGPDVKMLDVTHPKVMVATVDKSTTSPEIHFFNNCFQNDDCKYVWEVARYTSAAPLLFKESDGFVDGGVFCNNPTEDGLTEIFYQLGGKKLPIALVVSVGCGKYDPDPDKPKELGSVDVQDYFFLGNWISPLQLVRRTKNLIILIKNALEDSERVVKRTTSRCGEQGIPFYRFNTTLEQKLRCVETDNEKLMDLVLQTKMQFSEHKEMDKLVELFHLVAESSKRIAAGSIEEQTETSSP